MDAQPRLHMDGQRLEHEAVPRAEAHPGVRIVDLADGQVRKVVVAPTRAAARPRLHLSSSSRGGVLGDTAVAPAKRHLAPAAAAALLVRPDLAALVHPARAGNAQRDAGRLDVVQPRRRRAAVRAGGPAVLLLDEEDVAAGEAVERIPGAVVEAQAAERGAAALADAPVVELRVGQLGDDARAGRAAANVPDDEPLERLVLARPGRARGLPDVYGVVRAVVCREEAVFMAQQDAEAVNFPFSAKGDCTLVLSHLMLAAEPNLEISSQRIEIVPVPAAITPHPLHIIRRRKVPVRALLSLSLFLLTPLKD